MKQIFTIALLLTTTFNSNSQDAIPLRNPSFEGWPQHSRVPEGWFNCGQSGESPPDTHPSGDFGVAKAPMDGDTYLGLVVRDNNSWESVGQGLQQPVTAGQCYLLSLYLCRSDKYVSLSRAANEISNYTVPAILQIWGGNKECERSQLLASTEPVNSFEWQYYELILKPAADFTYLTVEAYYDPFQLSGPYNGNILIDKMSGLLPVDCSQEPAPPQPVTDLVSRRPAGQVESHSAPLILREELPSESELAVFITEHGKQAKFSTTNPGFYNRYFTDATITNRNIYYGNHHLYLIARALAAHPDYKAVIAVGGEDKQVMKVRQANIRDIFLAAGLPGKQFKLERLSPSSPTEEWLWPPEEHEYLIRLEKK